MPRRQKEPLRALTDAEQFELERLSRSQQTAAAVVSRARTVLAVARGRPYTVAARETGRKSADGVAKLVARFNAHGLAALETRPGGRRVLGGVVRSRAGPPKIWRRNHRLPLHSWRE